MIKFCLQMESNATLYGFGLTEANLNRIEFNKEPIFFNFDYAGHPNLWGLILFLERYGKAEAIKADLGNVALSCERFLDERRGVTLDTLRVFPFGRDVMDEFRRTNYWAFATTVNVTDAKDQQLFFAGPDENAIEEYMQRAGLLGKKTKRTTKGFGTSR
jgi:hypothetical protein